MHPASTYAPLEFDGRMFGEFLVNLISGEDHQVFVAEHEGAIVGALLCSVHRSFFGPDLAAVEYACFVLPEYRKSSIGLHLLYAYCDWAEEKGAKRITAGNSAGAPDEGYVALASRAGLTKAGSIVYRNVEE